jgi:putative ABC transport system permease protein
MLSRLKTALRALLRRALVERELDEELRHHIEQQTEQNVRLGMSPEEARDEARKAFGGVEQSKERSRDARGVRWIEELWQDLRYGLRMLLKNRGFTVVAMLTLALGIGANTAIFSVVNSVLLRSLPYQDPERIVQIWNANGGLTTQGPISEPEFNEYRNQSQSFDQVAAYVVFPNNLTGIKEPERVLTAATSSGFFPALGVRMELGRPYSSDEDQRGRNGVVVLSHRLWQRHFSSDPNLIGKAIILNGRSRTVIGITPPGFGFPSDKVDAWTPAAINPASTTTGAHYLNVIARLRPESALDQAKAELKVAVDRIKQRFPEYYKGAEGFTARVVPLREEIVGDIRPALLVLFGSVGFILLIACANVANLLLARAATRQKEVAVRMALGASRRRILRQLLTESLLLSVLGGAFGLLLAYWGIRFLVAERPPALPRIDEINIDGWALGFTMLVSLLTGMIFGLAPALYSSKPDLNGSLKEGGRGGAESMGHNRARGLLVVSQVTLSVVLLVGAGLMIKSFWRLMQVNPGYNPENVLTLRLSLPGGTPYPQAIAFYQQLTQRAAALPGAQAAAIVSQLPLDAPRSNVSFEVEGQPSEFNNDDDPIADFNTISSDYFLTMGIPLLHGRSFTDRDNAQSPTVVIVNQSLARRLWPGEDPIGKRIRLIEGMPWMSIVGVAPDLKNQSLSAVARQEIYLPYVQANFGQNQNFTPYTIGLVARAALDPASLSGAIRGEVRALDKSLPVYDIKPMERIVADSISQPHFTTLLLSGFAGIALILVTVGVYGVISYSVAQRTREIGIRKALGAQTRDVMTLFVGQGLALALIGVTIGSVVAFALTRVMTKLLYEVSATDAATFIAVPLLITTVSLMACYVPVRRAVKIDPMIALRHE